ncbi:MAG: metal ABC transporter permease [Gammaproteobacteria bacterium]|nr:metal ABC transporter permease [Gammaproteobacteria bacterium]MDE0248439.1 metal ABC transporter permease [Gammaproteobacteria bacterium]
MSLGELIGLVLTDYTIRTVSIGSAALGAVAGALGCFALLRRQSLLGDAISHAALPGIVLAFLLTGSRAMPVLVLGAALAGWLGTLVVLGIVRNSRISEDAALGIVLSVFFGFGLVVLTLAQRRPTAAQAGLETFLFGQAATLLEGDVALIVVVGTAAVLVLALLWKEFKLLTFDREFAVSIGLSATRLDLLLTGLLVAAIVLGLQAVGVVLMSALIVAPAAAARQWTNSLSVMVALAGVLGAIAGAGGALLSSFASGIPTGPTIVLIATGAVGFSLLAAPERGLASRLVRDLRTRRRVQSDGVLADLYALACQHPGRTGHPHPVAVLKAMQRTRGGVERSLRRLEADGWAREVQPGEWSLTTAGLARARDGFRAELGADAPPVTGQRR